MLSLTLFPLLAVLARSQEVLYTLNDATATFYYELGSGNGQCAERAGGPGWFSPDVSASCEVYLPYGTYASRNTNRIVALNGDMVSGDKAKWCGKQVQIFAADGREITIPEGPFILWDSCAACVSEAKFDLSVPAYIAASQNGMCGTTPTEQHGMNNPTGFTVKVLNVDLSGDLGVSKGGPAPAPAPVTPLATNTPLAGKSQQETNKHRKEAKAAKGQASSSSWVLPTPEGESDTTAPSASSTWVQESSTWGETSEEPWNTGASDQPSSTDAWGEPSPTDAWGEPESTEAWNEPSSTEAWGEPSSTEAWDQPDETPEEQPDSAESSPGDWSEGSNWKRKAAGPRRLGMRF